MGGTFEHCRLCYAFRFESPRSSFSVLFFEMLLHVPFAYLQKKYRQNIKYGKKGNLIVEATLGRSENKNCWQYYCCTPPSILIFITYPKGHLQIPLPIARTVILLRLRIALVCRTGRQSFLLRGGRTAVLFPPSPPFCSVLIFSRSRCGVEFAAREMGKRQGRTRKRMGERDGRRWGSEFTETVARAFGNSPPATLELDNYLFFLHYSTGRLLQRLIKIKL